MEPNIEITTEKRLEQILEVYRGSRVDAANILEDPEMAEKVLSDAFLKAEGFCRELPCIEQHIMTMLELSGDYISGQYDLIPHESAVNIFSAIIYLMIPLDMLPDFIPPIGYIDDALIAGLVANEEMEELNKYRRWKGTEE